MLFLETLGQLERFRTISLQKSVVKGRSSPCPNGFQKKPNSKLRELGFAGWEVEDGGHSELFRRNFRALLVTLVVLVEESLALSLVNDSWGYQPLRPVLKVC